MLLRVLYHLGGPLLSRSTLVDANCVGLPPVASAEILAQYQPAECAAYLKNAGYA
jgi:hypothetical protein